METPTRTFIVYDTEGQPHGYEGTLPKISDAGTLEILRDIGGTLWTVAIFPPGAYDRVESQPPTEETVDAFAAIRAQRMRDASIKQELAQMPSGLPGGRLIQ